MSELYMEDNSLDGTDYVLNLDQFETGTFNFIFCIGLPGSGKGTFGRKLSEKFNVVHIELDIFDQCGNMSPKEIRSYGEPFVSYIFHTQAGQWYYHNAKTLSVNEKIQGNKDFIDYVIGYCKANRNKRFIIDGTPIYASMPIDEISNYPIIIKGTTADQSFMNKVNRDLGKPSDHLHSDVRKKDLDGLRTYYQNDSNALSEYIEKLKRMATKVESKETIATEEALSSKERNALATEVFGIPSQRRYPLHDKAHIMQAIRMFNHVDKEHEKELAENILAAMERFGISTDVIGDRNRLQNYI